MSSAADLNCPVMSPIQCGLSSSFFQVTAVPAVTGKVAGAKAKLSILTLAGTECLLDSTSCCAAPVAGHCACWSQGASFRLTGLTSLNRGRLDRHCGRPLRGERAVDLINR